MDLANALKEELNVDTAFTVHLGSLSIPVAESTVISWVVIAILVVLTLILTRNLKVENPGKAQLCLETVVTGLENKMREILGPNAEEYAEYLVTVCLFIGLANIIGIFGMKPPTKDLNVSGGLAIMSIVLVEAAGIRAKKVSGWLKSFTQPIAIITPINILEIGIRPLSLCMRLFGNVLGSFIIMELIKQVVPILAPPFLSLYFDFFDGFIQAYVFVFLTGLYIKDAVGEDSAKKRKAGKTARIAGASADTAKA
jgi:F-type H+-transporting ATPase subunit a